MYTNIQMKTTTDCWSFGLQDDFKILKQKEGELKKHGYKIKTTEEAPMVYMLTYRQTDCIEPPVWFVAVILFFSL